MSQNRTEPRSAIPVGQQIGQAVGQAESALTGLLDEVLEQTQTKRETYLALQRTAVIGGEVTRDQYVRDLSDSLDLNVRAAVELADSLVVVGMLTAADGRIRLADAGAELLEKIVCSIGAITTPLWGSLDPADIETTVTTLREITTRARARRPAEAQPPVAPAAEARPAAPRSGALGGQS